MRRLILIYLLFLSTSVYANLHITEVVVNCGTSKSCSNHSDRFQILKNKFRNIVHLRQTLKVIVSVGGVRDFSWSLEEEGGKGKISISFIPKYQISQVKISSKNSQIKDYVERNSKIKPGQWFEGDVFHDEDIRLRQYLGSKGYPLAKVNFKTQTIDEFIEVLIDIKPGDSQIINQFAIVTNSTVIRRFAELKFNELLNKNFDIQNLRSKADELEADLYSYGYLLSSVTIKPQIDGLKVKIIVNIENDKNFAFNIKEKPLPYQDVKIEFNSALKENIKRFKRSLDEPNTIQAMQEILRKNAFLKPELSVRIYDSTHLHGEKISMHEIILNRGVRTRLRGVRFTGSQFYSDTKLLEMWKSQASELSLEGFFDEESFNRFSDYLRNQYIDEGFVRAKVLTPRFIFNVDQSEVEIDYNVQEGSRVLVDDIKFLGVSPEDAIRLIDVIKTKVGEPFNPNQFRNDVKAIVDDFHISGWYFADVINKDDEDIVKYGSDRSSVKIVIKVHKDKYITLDNVIIVGLRKTKPLVIKRRTPLKRGEPISPQALRDLESSLSATGLFASVRIRPVMHNGETSLTDVVVEVTERDYGLIEIAPGYRTDIGIKLSGTISYINLFGENISTSLTGQVNQRLDFQAFDSRRRSEGKSLVEYNITNNLNVPDLKETYIDYGLSLSAQRRRFFSFDADIQRISNTLSRDFGSNFSIALRHQFESISQFDATEVRDNGNFVIGALTPSFTADFRNSRINPTSGAWFNISNEFANPNFLSQRSEDLTINFYKLIMRNRFYIPIPRGTIAISVVGGLQENLAKNVRVDEFGNPVIDPESGQVVTQGYIPNIKLFRLTGTDIVRGYTDEEINRLPDGKDIGEDRIQNKAYMANIKVEPRYFINDSLMAGLFFDAGRIYRDSVDFGELRQSAGVTFKIVTPVGTLDFDYGFKLLRKRNPDGTLEAPGRFHVSIGFF